MRELWSGDSRKRASQRQILQREMLVAGEDAERVTDGNDESRFSA
jgi:hypothetical protein